MLFQQERYGEAIVQAIELQRKDPLMPGLAELQGRIMARLSEQRRQSYEQRDRVSAARTAEDISRHQIVPETYNLRRHVRGEETPLFTEPSRMQRAQDRPVSIHLTDVQLDDVIAQIGIAENINIVADSNLSDRTLSIHAEDTPLSEILEFVGRNLGVSFSVGENIIWATTAVPADTGQPLETRMYRLRKGLSGEEAEAGNPGIIEVVERFIPSVNGADILFNRKSHVLLVKNTRNNLRQIEGLIDALDISPPQVLIEARFMNAGVSDLRELGVDWILGSPIVMSHQTRHGQPTRNIRTRIDPAGGDGRIIGFTPFESASQGLNLTYTGVLTDPVFQAVVHALEQSGKARTLSVPRITTVNNRESTIRIGRDIRFFEEFDVVDIPSQRTGETEFRDSRLVPTGTPQLEEVGIELVVTPSVGADLATINLNLKPEISDLAGWEYYATEGSSTSTRNGGTNDVSQGMVKLPIFERSFIDTEIVVRSGETVVMGGLVKSREQRNREAVPLLSAIPLLGQLFRRDFTETVQDNLIIFVTATLISDVGESLIPLSELPEPDEPEPQADPVEPAEAEANP